MSFGDFDRQVGSSGMSLNPTLGSPLEDLGATAYARLLDKIKSSIFATSGNVASIQRMLSHFGTPKDTPILRDKLQNLMHATQDIILQTTADLKELGQHRNVSTDDRAKKLEQQKLSKDFQVVLGRFQQIQRSHAEKSREFVAQIKAKTHTLEDLGQEDHVDAPLIQEESRRKQELVRLDREIEYNEAVIVEREQDIIEIEKAIVEVNEIFRDLGSIVNEQQGMFDNIEANIESAAVRTGDAAVELDGARRYQKKAQKRLVCLMLTFGVIVGIIILVLVLR